MKAQFQADTFKSQYPGADTNAKSGTAIEFKSEDSEYRAYIPGADKKKSTLETDGAGALTVKLVQDHIRHGAHDDHSTTTLIFESSGKLARTNHEFAIEVDKGGAFKIPDIVPKSLELAVEIAGALGALETAGISEAVAQEVVADIAAICDAFNKICAAIDNLTDDGGRLNFPAVVCHNMNKVSCSIVSVA